VLVRELRGDDPRSCICLAVVLRDQISSGQAKPGAPVPSITTLAREHGHARQTCSKAMQLHADAGLLVMVPGLGYYVTPDVLDHLGIARADARDA